VFSIDKTISKKRMNIKMCKKPFEINFMKWLIKQGISFIQKKEFAEIIDFYEKKYKQNRI
jgi:hypothetical protein